MSIVGTIPSLRSVERRERTCATHTQCAAASVVHGLHTECSGIGGHCCVCARSGAHDRDDELCGTHSRAATSVVHTVCSACMHWELWALCEAAGSGR